MVSLYILKCCLRLSYFQTFCVCMQKFFDLIVNTRNFSHVHLQANEASCFISCQQNKRKLGDNFRPFLLN